MLKFNSPGISQTRSITRAKQGPFSIISDSFHKEIDRIYGVFDNQLPAALRKLPFDRHLSLQNVKKVVSEADGYQPHLIAPEQGYRRLIEGSLSYFRGPAEASADAVSCPSFCNY